MSVISSPSRQENLVVKLYSTLPVPGAVRDGRQESMSEGTVNKESFRKWVKALRSGGYQQIKGDLGSGTKRCALGVAVDVFEEEVGRSYAGGDIGKWFGTPQYHQVAIKDRVVTFASGVVINPSYMPVMALNDSLGWSFEKIADAIEFTYLADEGPEDDEPTGSGDDSNKIVIPDDASELTGELVPA